MRVSTAEFIIRFGDLSDRAGSEPVTITENGRDRLVLVSAGEYARLKQTEGGGASERKSSDALVSPAGEMPELWGALRGTVSWDSDGDITEPTGEIWDAKR